MIEPSAGADRATLAFLCQAYTEDTAPDENGKLHERVVLKLHPAAGADQGGRVSAGQERRHARGGREDLSRAQSRTFNVFYDEKGAVGRRYRRQDEAGTPYCITVDGQTLQDQTVTIRDRDTLEQWRIKADECAAELTRLLK